MRTPWFKTEVFLRVDEIILSPSVDDAQEAIDDAATSIVTASRKISQWQFRVRFFFIFAYVMQSNLFANRESHIYAERKLKGNLSLKSQFQFYPESSQIFASFVI